MIRRANDKLGYKMKRWEFPLGENVVARMRVNYVVTFDGYEYQTTYVSLEFGSLLVYGTLAVAHPDSVAAILKDAKAMFEGTDGEWEHFEKEIEI